MSPPTPEGTLPGVLTFAEAAARRRCSIRTLERHVRSGNLPEYRLDLRTRVLRVEDVDALDIRPYVRQSLR